MFSLTDKKTLVTGATGGIGGAIAQAFHAQGAVVAVSGSKQDKLAAFATQLSSPSPHVGEGGVGGESGTPPPPAPSHEGRGKIFPIVCDLAKLETVEGLVRQAEAAMGGIDVLVCNAGVTRDNLALRMKDEEWQQAIDINLTASFRLARAALRGMLKQRSGRIIFITSVVGWSGNAGQANYCASKAGLTGLSKSLAHEVASRGITVNCIAPGFIKTAMTDALNEEQQQKISENIPLGRMGTTDEIAASAVFLASAEGAYITGQTIHVNGGLWMG